MGASDVLQSCRKPRGRFSQFLTPSQGCGSQGQEPWAVGPPMNSHFTDSPLLPSQPPKELNFSGWESRICGWHFFPVTSE